MPSSLEFWPSGFNSLRGSATFRPVLGTARVRFYFTKHVELQAYGYVKALLDAGHSVRVIPIDGMRLDAVEFWPPAVFMTPVADDFVNVVVARAQDKVIRQVDGGTAENTPFNTFWTDGHVNIAIWDQLAAPSGYEGCTLSIDGDPQILVDALP